MGDGTVVRNAADPEQVRYAARRDRKRLKDEQAAHQGQLSTYEGRAFVAMWLRSLGVYRSVMETSARIYYLAGRQDVGHELQAKLLDAAPEEYDLMEQEARARWRREQAEIEAAHTAPADDKSKN